MKSGIKIICIIFIETIIVLFPCFSQYEISISMKTKNDTVILGHIFAKEQSMYADTIIVLQNGKGVFKSNRVLPKGLYFIYNDKRKLFDILIGDNQKFGIEADTTDFLNRTRFISSPDNDAFYEFFRYEVPHSAKIRQLEEQHKKAADDAEKKAISEQWQTLSKERMAFIKKIISENEELYVSKFLKAMFVQLELPEPPRDDQGRITDSTYVYWWYRNHFFDNFNIYDPDMLRTPLYEKKLLEYLDWFTRNHLVMYPVDTVCAELDRMLTKAKPVKAVFQCVLATMFNHFTKSELMVRENIWVHLVDKWYVPYADWANVDELKKAADKVRSTLIGKVAPPLDQLLVLPPGHFKAAALDTAIKNDIHAGTIIPDFRKNIQSKYLAILFWDINCGHCKTTMQEMWDVFEAHKSKGLQVITVQVLQSKEGKAKWIDFINEHGMYDWINAWIIYDNKWHDLYEASVVPIMYFLNEKKEIIFKRVQPDQIKSVMETIHAEK